jgi:hypothetical protein
MPLAIKELYTGNWLMCLDGKMIPRENWPFLEGEGRKKRCEEGLC